jgi:ankyrin repeat protein
VPTVSLPDNPNREHLRNEARALQRAVQAGDSEALARAVRHHPAPVPDAATFPLSAAQLVVARGYGLVSWPRLMGHLDVIDRYRRDPDLGGPTADPLADFCRYSCLSYHNDDPAHLARARGLLARHPDLPTRDVWAAAAAADVASVRAFLATDPGLARREGGPYRWEPLMYLAYSRLDPAAPADRVLATARLLLDCGADPDAGYLWRGMPSPFTLLTGAFGEGEGGPARQPRHPHAVALARLLLQAGADPNDRQTLYNRMFRPDDDHLVLLFEYGLGRPTNGRWAAQLGGAMESVAEMFARQVGWAVEHGFADRMRLLAGHGVDIVSPLPDGRAPMQIAARNGDRAMMEVVSAAGAARPELSDVDALAAACLAGDRDTVRRADPATLAELRSRHPALVLRAATGHRPDAVALLADLGFDLDTRAHGATALHSAAWDGDDALVRALLAAGADPNVRDARFDATPLGWAEYAGQPSTIALLAGVTATYTT